MHEAGRPQKWESTLRMIRVEEQSTRSGYSVGVDVDVDG